MKIVKFMQPSCAPCKQVGEYLDSKNITYENMNVWDHPDMASKYKLMSVPVTILFDDFENEIKRSVGFKPNELQDIINSLI